MSDGNSLLCRRLEAVLLKRDRIKGETTHEEWIWFEQKTGPGGSLPAPATFPHIQPHTWDVLPLWHQRLSQHPAQLQTSVTSPNLLLGLLQSLIFWLIPGVAARPRGWTHPTFVWEPVQGAGSLIRV